ncbi:hypothetical protein ACFV0T_01900 [Streptomyces sp. NPDC059582]|uniref:hypothetical protein n=1 Tax=Streptomyces sp. NPDC059582 TaxID=3346875 RepID=UPI0036C3DE24
MHRTTTTATLLVSVAVSALTGCVTVQRPPAAGPTAPAAPAPAPVPRPDGEAEPQVVQAPAREALELVGPSRPAAPTAPARRHAAPAAQAPAPHDRLRPPHPEARRSPRPHAAIPDLSEPVRRNTDVCALGKKYGGWRGDSPEAVICDQAYGR